MLVLIHEIQIYRHTHERRKGHGSGGTSLKGGRRGKQERESLCHENRNRDYLRGGRNPVKG